MDNEKKSMIKDALILFAITLVAGLLLGVVYDVTKEPIAQQKAKAKIEASKNVFASAQNFEAYDAFDADSAQTALSAAGLSGMDIDEVSAALDESGNVLGYVITVTDHEGYGGDIQFSMGITMDGTLNGISLLSISETAGLGMKAGDVLVPQFTDKKAEQFTYTKSGAANDSEIDAISGATITTKAIVNGVNAGLEYFRSVLETEGGAANE
ncbi:MAG: RnfABCDGE type electron transport complex subunit G [Lachnospiraceae bacterium]|nr:RnfABCDGE type electron transport complex subunit G [Lachnospiraceae bacterium]